MPNYHPDSTCNHVVLAAGLQAKLDSIAGKPFGTVGQFDKTGTWAIIDCRSPDPISTYPELSDAIIESPPAEMTAITGDNPENIPHKVAMALAQSVFWAGEVTP